jgi:S-adenosylmethionine decarboxylase
MWVDVSPQGGETFDRLATIKILTNWLVIIYHEERRDTRMNLGTHYLAEFFNCDRTKINDIEFVERLMIEATELSGACMIKPLFHHFSPQGISGVIVIAESHFAIHTWPEHGYTAVDLFSCSDFDYKTAMNHIRKNIGAGFHSVALVRRGIFTDSDEPQPAEWEEVDIDA